MAKRGRKPIEIDWKEFEALCTIQATVREMAIVFGCSEDTIQRAVKREYKASFSEVFWEKRQRGFISLRQRIWTAALNGNTALLIFLSKQYLGMADQTVVRLPGQPVHGDEPKPDLSRLTDEQLAIQRVLSAIAEGLDPALGARQLAAIAKQLPQETPQPEGGNSAADSSQDRRGDVEETPPPVRLVN